MTVEQIGMAAKEYAAKIQETDIYRDYCKAREQIKKDPELYAKVNDYCRTTPIRISFLTGWTPMRRSMSRSGKTRS